MMDPRTNRYHTILPLILLTAFAVSIFVIVRQTGLEVEDIRSFAKKNKNATTASQAYADKLIAQRERSGSCVGAACLADVVARSARENPDYYDSLKGSPQGSVGANTLAVLEMTRVATGEIITTDPEAKNAVDYCNAHGGKNCSDPKNMADFLAANNKDLFDIYNNVTAENTVRISDTARAEYASCMQSGNSPVECVGVLTMAVPINTPVPSPVASPSPSAGTVPLPIVSPVPVLPPRVLQAIPSAYYSQVDPAWADQMIPGQRYKFVQAGCGEVTVANILTQAGIPTNPRQAAEIVKKDPEGYGTAYSDNITALTQKGFRADQYPGSFKELNKYMGPNDVVWLAVRANNATYRDMGHHTYIDGYSMVNGKPVYNLRDPFFGTDMKCGADGDRGFDCSSPGRSVHLDAPPDTNNLGTGTVAIILSPPGS